MIFSLISKFIHGSFRVVGPLLYILILAVIAHEVAQFWSGFYFNSALLESTKDLAAWPVGLFVGWSVATFLFGGPLMIVEMRNYIRKLAQHAGLE